MKNINRRPWFIHLIIVVICMMVTRLSNNSKSTYDCNDVHVSKTITVENLIKRLNDRQRAKRLLGGLTMMIDRHGYPSSSTIGTTQSNISTSTTPQFISTTTTTTPTPPNTCNNGTHVTLSNSTCILRQSLIISALTTLNSSSANDTEKGNAISTYITAVINSNISSTSSNALTIGQIDEILRSSTGNNYTVNNNDSIIIMTQPNSVREGVTIIGTSFGSNTNGRVITNLNKDNVIHSSLRAAGIITLSSLFNVTSFNMLIINNPTSYQTVDTSTNSILVSSIVIATINKESYNPENIIIDLFFQVLIRLKSNENGNYLCAFYDTDTLQWNASGCTKPIFNSKSDRHECQCYHLTSFALIWSLKLPPSSTNDTHAILDAQDKASITFQLISITCFLGIIIHGITVRIINPRKYTQSRHLPPLISFAITMIFFVFYIALGLTVYTKPKFSEQTKCFLSSSVLMFFVYFFLILMFCAKTCAGYFNYIHFVQLFPGPSSRQCLIMLLTSFIISITWVAFAAGFNSNPSFKTSQLDPHKLCWFTRDVIHYFIIIPMCLFVLINIILFILVAVSIVNHVRNATSSDQSHARIKQSVLVLLSLYVTQGIGWLLGPLIIIPNSTSSMIFGWLFVIFNGLEGLWVVILYTVIQINHIDESRRVTAAKIFATANNAIRRGYEVATIENVGHEGNILASEGEVQHENNINEVS